MRLQTILKLILMDDNYFQPNFYHFSEDSIELAKIAISIFKDLNNLNMLDACCGCGVIGLEVSRNIKLQSLVLCEIQNEYIEFISKNIKKFNNALEVEILNNDVATFTSNKKFDLITINPPYFEAQKSRRSSNENKNTCRIYNKGELGNIFSNLIQLLNSNGKIVFSIREHGLDEISEKVNLLGRKIEKVTDLNSASIFVIS